MQCMMCDRPNKNLVRRWYQYDNGEQFQCMVCPKCDVQHANMLAGVYELNYQRAQGKGGAVDRLSAGYCMATK